VNFAARNRRCCFLKKAPINVELENMRAMARPLAAGLLNS
jgi:hypothetical protein